MKYLFPLIICLTACDGSVIDAFPGAPECRIPAIGSTCPVQYGIPAVEAWVETQAACHLESEILITEARPDGVLEWACVPEGPRTYRYVNGVVTPDSLAYQTPDGSLVLCEGREITAVYPLARFHGIEGVGGDRYLRLTTIDDEQCLALGTCEVVSGCEEMEEAP